MKTIVIVLLVLFGVALAVPSSRAKIETNVFHPIRDKVNYKLVPPRLEEMADQMGWRLGRQEGFPSDWEGWLRRDYSGVPEDPWGNQYFLQKGRRDYSVGSMGPDGVQGTEDDVLVTRKITGS